MAIIHFETELQKCIRMGITIFKILIWGGILWEVAHTSAINVPEFVLPVNRYRNHASASLNFQYTSPNKNFESSYRPLIS